MGIIMSLIILASMASLASVLGKDPQVRPGGAQPAPE
jgi:hypothetical protein